MKAVISRKYTPFQTLGRMIVFDGNERKLEIVTLELPDNGNQKNVSCIPEGVYDVVPYLSPRRGGCFQVLNVPNRTAILIHPGNYLEDTEGCILPGLFYADIDDNGVTDVAESRAAMNRLNNVLTEPFKLHII